MRHDGNELKPFPFCGGEAKLKDATYGNGISAYVVRCKNVDCDVRPSTSYFRVRNEAIERWNRRASEQKVSMALYDQEEIHHNCTVQILSNSVTGDVSIGWWPEDRNPYVNE